MEENKETNLAMSILSNRITNLLGDYSRIEEDSPIGIELQEKIETLAEIREQVSLGNETLTKKVIDKKNMGIL